MTALGYQWASFLLAGLALLLMPFREFQTMPFWADARLTLLPPAYLFFTYGKRLRGTSKFAQA